MEVAATTREDGAVLAWGEVITEVIREGLALTPLTASEVTEARAPALTSQTEAGVCWAPRPL